MSRLLTTAGRIKYLSITWPQAVLTENTHRDFVGNIGVFIGSILTGPRDTPRSGSEINNVIPQSHHLKVNNYNFLTAAYSSQLASASSKGMAAKCCIRSIFVTERLKSPESAMAFARL